MWGSSFRNQQEIVSKVKATSTRVEPIRGFTVINDMSDPVPGATVQMKNGFKCRGPKIVSNSDGSFEYPALLPEKNGSFPYTLHYSKDSHRDAEAELDPGLGASDVGLVHLYRFNAEDVQPTVVLTTTARGRIGATSSVVFTATFSQQVTGVEQSDFDIAGGSNAFCME